MDAKEIIDELKEAVGDVEKKGELISPSAFLDYLAALEEDATETAKLHEAQFKANSEANIEMFKSVILAGQAAIKSSILINGGAAVALLAFIGKIWSESHSSITTGLLANGMIYFAHGVLLGALTSGFTYLSQLSYHHTHWFKGKLLHGLAILSGLGAYALFGLGSWFVFYSFSNQFSS